ncbi:unnamed protein product [Amaranthus hypochondriacus]
MYRERSCEGFATRFDFHNGSRRDQWRGPWEPPLSRAVLNLGGVVSLFIDGIPRNASRFDLKKIFSKVGVVADIYISKKSRKNRFEYFGFVRFYHTQEAKQAVSSFDGMVVFGSKIRVSMARYQKDGTPITIIRSAATNSQAVHRHIKRSSHSDSRWFADVAMGKKRQLLKSFEGNNKIPVLVSLQVPENNDILNKLKQAELVDNEEIINLKNTTTENRASKQTNVIPTPSTVHVTVNTEEVNSERMNMEGHSVSKESELRIESIKEGETVADTIDRGH